MILDKDNLFSNAQAITADAASTNVIDLGAAGAARGTNLDIVATVVETFNNLTTLAVTLQTATDAAFTSPITIGTAMTRTLATSGHLVAGDEINLGRVPDNALQYIRLYYDVTGTAPSTGKVTAGVIAGRK